VNTEAQYVLIIEDDTIATKGWYGQTKKGLQPAARKTEGMSYNSQDCELAIFYFHQLPHLHNRMASACKQVRWC
jgi:hypothetical protein